MKKNMQILVIEENYEHFENLADGLSDLGHKPISAKGGGEARLKFSNQEFDFLVMNMDIKGLAPLDFALHIRETEKRKNIKERMPILVNGSNAEDFHKNFATLDNVQFLERPFSVADFKKILRKK